MRVSCLRPFDLALCSQGLITGTTAKVLDVMCSVGLFDQKALDLSSLVLVLTILLREIS